MAGIGRAGVPAEVATAGNEADRASFRFHNPKRDGVSNREIFMNEDLLSGTSPRWLMVTALRVFVTIVCARESTRSEVFRRCWR